MTAFSALSVPETLCSPSNCLTSIRLDFPWPHRHIISVEEEKEKEEKEKEVEDDEEELYSEILRSDELFPFPDMQFFLCTELDMHLHHVR